MGALQRGAANRLTLSARGLADPLGVVLLPPPWPQPTPLPVGPARHRARLDGHDPGPRRAPAAASPASPPPVRPPDGGGRPAPARHPHPPTAGLPVGGPRRRPALLPSTVRQPRPPSVPRRSALGARPQRRTAPPR